MRSIGNAMQSYVAEKIMPRLRNAYQGFGPSIIRLLGLTILLFTAAFPLPSLAAEPLDATPPHPTATLIGPRAEAPIPLALRPAANQPNVGYGMNGDAVTVMEQLASFLPEADPTTAWNHVRLNVEPYTEGWVQGKFLLLESDSNDASS